MSAGHVWRLGMLSGRIGCRCSAGHLSVVDLYEPAGHLPSGPSVVGVS